MPIYMDRHDVSAEVTAENIAQLHNEDLKVQDKFGCKGLTYWFDDERKTAFCLAEAPSKEAMIAMHDYAHGKVPHQIIEVDKMIVESFLGRIEDPEKSKNTELNIINDPAFRSIMAIRLTSNPLYRVSIDSSFGISENVKKCLFQTVNESNGRIVYQDPESYLISFTSVKDAILCAHSIQKDNHSDKLSIGISAGAPVTSNTGFFEKAINSAKLMCEIGIAPITVSAEVRELYESLAINKVFDSRHFYTLTTTDEAFLKKLMEFTESNFSNETLTSDDFHSQLGYSKSQFYRKITGLLKKSPNIFLKEYRLHKSIPLINKNENNISEIAFQVGFKSQSYFSKCFLKHFSVSPSDYKSTINT